MTEHFWERLNIPYGGYNSEIDQNIFDVAGAIVLAGMQGGFIYCTDIAERLELSATYVELIQYILASAKDSPFEYGTSPRGLFVSDDKAAQRFMEDFGEYMNASYEEQFLKANEKH